MLSVTYSGELSAVSHQAFSEIVFAESWRLTAESFIYGGGRCNGALEN